MPASTWSARGRAALQAIGHNVLEPARRPAATRAGRTQAALEATRIREIWSA